MPRNTASVPSVITMGGIPNAPISAPLIAPSPAPISAASASSSTAGASGNSTPNIATSIPDSARLAATDRSMPRVRITAICASASMNRNAVSLSIPTRLAGARNTGA